MPIAANDEEENDAGLVPLLNFDVGPNWVTCLDRPHDDVYDRNQQAEDKLRGLGGVPKTSNELRSDIEPPSVF